MVRACLLSAKRQSIEAVEVGGVDDIRRLIGYDTISSDLVGDFDRLYFDEQCFPCGKAGDSQVDRLIPVAGRGLFLGSGGGPLFDANFDVETLRQHVEFQ